MNRIQQTFDRLSRLREKALIGFVTAGDPDVEASIRQIEAMCEAGLDILELGVPFSDPTADGPVIQRASERALKNGVTLSTVLDMTRRIRQRTDIPIILFSYYNPILAVGSERFYREATAAGADGVLIVDLPPEESGEMTAGWPGSDLALIRLVSPTTPPDRMRSIAGGGAGFLYMVSKTGVTGSSGLDASEIRENTEALRAVADLPICVGFGISTAQDVAAVASVADGVVIGSAFERMIEENLDHPDLASLMAERVREYKAATRIG